MPSIEDMLIRIDASTQQMEKKLKSADRSIHRFQKNTDKRLKKVDASFDRLGSVIRTKLLPALGARELGRVVRGAVADLASLQNQADKLGLATTELQELRFAAQEVGISTQATDVAIQRFTRRLAEAREGGGELKGILEQYNVSLVDNQGNTRRAIDVLGDLANVMKRVQDPAEQLRIAFKAFDTEGVDFKNILSRGSEGLDELRESAHEAGVVISEELVASAAEFDTEWSRAMQAAEASYKGFAVSVLKVSRDMMRQLNDSQMNLMSRIYEQALENQNGFSQVSLPNDGLPTMAGMLSFQSNLSDPAFVKSLEEQLRVPEPTLPRPRATPDRKINEQIKSEMRAEEEAIELERQKREAILETVAALSFRAEQMRRNARDQDLYNQLQQAGVELKSVEGQRIQELVNEYHDYTEAQKEAEEQAKRLEDASSELGATFSSAFEDAVVNGEKLSGVLQGLLQDIIRIAAREIVVNPIAGAAKGFFSDFGSSLAGGFDFGSMLGFADGGNPPIGKPSVVGERGPEIIVPRTAQTVIPNHALGGVNMTQHVSIDARGADDGFLKKWPHLKQELITETTMAVAAQVGRGGAYAKQIGRRS